MQAGKLITGLTIGAIATLLIIPKTRNAIYSALCTITDSLKELADDAIDATERGSKEMNRISDKVQDVATSVKETKQSWQQ